VGVWWGSDPSLFDLPPDPVMRYYKCWSSTKVLTYPSTKGTVSPFYRKKHRMSLKANVTKACNALTQTEQGKADYERAIESIKREIGARKSWDKVRAILLPVVAGVSGVDVIDGEGKAIGTLVLDKDAKNYETARKRLQRLTSAIAVKKASEDSRMSFTKGQLSAVTKALAEFEGETLDDQIKALKTLLATKFA